MGTLKVNKIDAGSAGELEIIGTIKLNGGFVCEDKFYDLPQSTPCPDNCYKFSAFLNPGNSPAVVQYYPCGYTGSTVTTLHLSATDDYYVFCTSRRFSVNTVCGPYSAVTITNYDCCDLPTPTPTPTQRCPNGCQNFYFNNPNPIDIIVFYNDCYGNVVNEILPQNTSGYTKCASTIPQHGQLPPNTGIIIQYGPCCDVDPTPTPTVTPTATECYCKRYLYRNEDFGSCSGLTVQVTYKDCNNNQQYLSIPPFTTGYTECMGGRGYTPYFSSQQGGLDILGWECCPDPTPTPTRTSNISDCEFYIYTDCSNQPTVAYNTGIVNGKPSYVFQMNANQNCFGIAVTGIVSWSSVNNRWEMVDLSTNNIIATLSQNINVPIAGSFSMWALNSLSTISFFVTTLSTNTNCVTPTITIAPTSTPSVTPSQIMNPFDCYLFVNLKGRIVVFDPQTMTYVPNVPTPVTYISDFGNIARDKNTVWVYRNLFGQNVIRVYDISLITPILTSTIVVPTNVIISGLVPTGVPNQLYILNSVTNSIEIWDLNPTNPNGVMTLNFTLYTLPFNTSFTSTPQQGLYYDRISNLFYFNIIQTGQPNNLSTFVEIDVTTGIILNQGQITNITAGDTIINGAFIYNSQLYVSTTVLSFGGMNGIYTADPDPLNPGQFIFNLVLDLSTIAPSNDSQSIFAQWFDSSCTGLPSITGITASALPPPTQTPTPTITPTSNCTEIMIECWCGQFVAPQSGFINGKPSYTYNTSSSSGIVSGIIYWDSTLSWWIVEDTSGFFPAGQTRVLYSPLNSQTPGSYSWVIYPNQGIQNNCYFNGPQVIFYTTVVEGPCPSPTPTVTPSPTTTVECTPVVTSVNVVSLPISATSPFQVSSVPSYSFLGTDNYVTWGSDGSLLYDVGYNTLGNGTYTVLPNTLVWGPQGIYNKPIIRSSVWSQYPYIIGTSRALPIKRYLWLSECIYLSSSKTLYVGIGGDNGWGFIVNNTVVSRDMSSVAVNGTNNFTTWNIYPVQFNSGNNKLYYFGFNIGQWAGFGIEIYDNTYNELLTATTISDLNIIYSSSSRYGTEFDFVSVAGDPAFPVLVTSLPTQIELIQSASTLCSDGTVPDPCEGCIVSTPIYIQCTPTVTPTIGLSPTPTITRTPSNTPSLTPSLSPSSTPCVPETTPIYVIGNQQTIVSATTPWVVTAYQSQGGAWTNPSKFGARLYSTYDNLGNGTFVSLPLNNVWCSTNYSERPLIRSGVWTQSQPNNGTYDPLYYNIWLSECIDLPSAKNLFVGIGCDNFFGFVINGVLVNKQNFWSFTDVDNFYYWHIYEVPFNAGPNSVYIYGMNVLDWGVLGMEIYDNTYNEILTATTINDLNIIYSTANRIGTNFDFVSLGAIVTPVPGGANINYISFSGLPDNNLLVPNESNLYVDGSIPSPCDTTISVTLAYIPCSPTPTPTITKTPTLTPSTSITPTPTKTIGFVPSVTPTKTLTRTPSLTPSPTQECCRPLIYNNTSSLTLYLNFGLTDCNGNVLPTLSNPLLPGTGYTTCTFMDLNVVKIMDPITLAKYEITFTKGDCCEQPIPTPTKTSTPTVTPTLGTLYLDPCSVFLVNKTLFIATGYTVKVMQCLGTIIDLTPYFVGTGWWNVNFASVYDIANTQNKLWVSTSIGIWQYSITLSPFTISFDFTVPIPTIYTPGSGLTAIDDDNIIFNTVPFNQPEKIIKYTISTNTVQIWNHIPPNRSIQGDMLLTTTNDLICLYYDSNLLTSTITVHDFSTGTILYDYVNTQLTGFQSVFWGLFICNNELYVGQAQGQIYQFDFTNLTSPFSLTQSIPFSIQGASNSPECSIIELTGCCRTWYYENTSSLSMMVVGEYIDCDGRSFNQLIPPGTGYTRCINQNIIPQSIQMPDGTITFNSGPCCPLISPTPTSTVTKTPTPTPTVTPTITESPIPVTPSPTSECCKVYYYENNNTCLFQVGNALDCYGNVIPPSDFRLLVGTGYTPCTISSLSTIIGTPIPIVLIPGDCCTGATPTPTVTRTIAATPTVTSTPIPTCTDGSGCVQYKITNNTASSIQYFYQDCNGNSVTATTTTYYGSEYICGSYSVFPTYTPQPWHQAYPQPVFEWEIVGCCPPSPTPTQTPTITPTPQCCRAYNVINNNNFGFVDILYTSCYGITGTVQVYGRTNNRFCAATQPIVVSGQSSLNIVINEEPNDPGNLGCYTKPCVSPTPSEKPQETPTPTTTVTITPSTSVTPTKTPTTTVTITPSTSVTPTKTPTTTVTITPSTSVTPTPNENVTPTPSPTNCECYYQTITISNIDLNDAQGNSDPNNDRKVFVDYIPCGSDNPITISFDTNGVYTDHICVLGINIPSILIYYYKTDAQVTNTQSTVLDTRNCCTI